MHNAMHNNNTLSVLESRPHPKHIVCTQYYVQKQQSLCVHDVHVPCCAVLIVHTVVHKSLYTCTYVLLYYTTPIKNIPCSMCSGSVS